MEHLDVQREQHVNSVIPLCRPSEIDDILRLSNSLSMNIPFVRSDFYMVNRIIYFGELTFFPTSGYRAFIPNSFDREIGEWLSLPSIT